MKRAFLFEIKSSRLSQKINLKKVIFFVSLLRGGGSLFLLIINNYNNNKWMMTKNHNNLVSFLNAVTFYHSFLSFLFCSSISLSIHNPNRYICKLDISQKHLLFKKAQDDENINKWGIWLSSNLSMKKITTYAFQIEGKGGILFLGKKKDFDYETSYKILRSLKLASKLLLFEVFDQSYCDAATIYTQIFFERFL